MHIDNKNYEKEDDFLSYSKDSQKKYRDKCKTVTVRFTPPEMQEYDRMTVLLAMSGQSPAAYIKSLIHADLDAANIPYPPDTDDVD